MQNDLPVVLTHFFLDYSEGYEEHFYDYYQIHVFSLGKIISQYYDPSDFTPDYVKDTANNLLKIIRQRSQRKNQITMFQNHNKFMITEHKEFVDPGDILDFYVETLRYDYSDDFDDLFELIDGFNVELFIKEAFLKIGGEDLYKAVEPYVVKLRKQQLQQELRFNNLRELNKTDPLLKLEVYRIEKNYIPIKIHEFLCHDEESALFIPEHHKLIKQERIAYILQEISTGKLIENSIDDTIHLIKHNKWQRKNPSVIGLDEMRRMELDNEDPDFLSWDDYVANEDEYEEGDEDF